MRSMKFEESWMVCCIPRCK